MPIVTLRRIPPRKISHQIQGQLEKLVRLGAFRLGARLTSGCDLTEAIGVNRVVSW